MIVGNTRDSRIAESERIQSRDEMLNLSHESGNGMKTKRMSYADVVRMPSPMTKVFQTASSLINRLTSFDKPT